MSKEDDKKRRLFGQFAWIVNYKPQIREQHFHMGNQEVGGETFGEETEFEEVEETPQAPAPAEEMAEKAADDRCAFVADAEAISKCFKFNSDFVKQTVSTIVNEFYQGSNANLALIEITLFHHQQLKRRNSHKSFVMALAAWGIIAIADEDEFNLIVMGVSDKYKRMPKEGYLEWINQNETDRLTCERMGKKLDPSMKYLE
jgi:hypothetical protein